MSGGCCQGADRVFGDRTAAHELRRYRKKGPSKPTRILLDALRAAGVADATVLDIGGGVGMIQHELLESGAAHATGVDAAPAYLHAAAEEAERRGHADRLTVRDGDFVALADEVEAADVVTLDRVVCCYPDMPALVGRSAARARRLYGLVYPRDAWWTRLGFKVPNLWFRISRNPFRVFVHRASDVDSVVREHGLTHTLRRDAGPIWHVAVYERAASASSTQDSGSSRNAA